MMEIREYLDNNNNVINGEVVDLSTEMNKYKDLFDTMDETKNNDNNNNNNNEMEEKIRKAMEKVKEKFGQLDTNTTTNNNNGLDKDEEEFILELEKISRQNEIEHKDTCDIINDNTNTITSKYVNEFDALDDMERKEQEEELNKLRLQQERLKMPVASTGGWGKGFLSSSKSKKPKASITTDNNDNNDNIKKEVKFNTKNNDINNNDDNDVLKKNDAFNGTVFERFP